MQFRTLQITLLSGKNLPSEKTPINAVVSISNEIDGSKQEHTTPTWNSQMEFKVGETALQKNSLTLEFRLLCNDVVVGHLKVSVKQLFDSRKSPYVGGEDGGGELTFSYKFIDESAPNASGSGPGWNRVEDATKAAANGAGIAIKAAADGAGVGIKAAANVAGVGIKAAANVANEAAWTLVKGVKEVQKKVESGGLGGKKDGKKKVVEAGWWERLAGGANKRNEKEKEKEKAKREQMNAAHYKPPPQQKYGKTTQGDPSHHNSASTKNGKTTQGGPSHHNSASTNNSKTTQGGPSHHSSASTKNGQTQGGLSHHNSGLWTGEGTGTYNPFQTVANKFMSTDLREAILGQGAGKTKTNPND